MGALPATLPSALMTYFSWASGNACGLTDEFIQPHLSRACYVLTTGHLQEELPSKVPDQPASCVGSPVQCVGDCCSLTLAPTPRPLLTHSPFPGKVPGPWASSLWSVAVPWRFSVESAPGRETLS